MAKSEYASKAEEQQIISSTDAIEEPDIAQVTDLIEIRKLQKDVKEIHVSPSITEYIVSITSAIRNDPDISWGPSTRGSIALYKCARVWP